MKSRFRSLAFASTFLLAGCDSFNNSVWGQYAELMHQSFSASFRTVSITRTQAAAIPYASLGYRVAEGPEQLLVLATDSNGEQLWTSARHVVLTTQAGRVLRTQGLGHDLGATTAASGRDVPAPAMALTHPVTYTRLLDVTDMGIYGAPLTCRMSGPRPETTRILGSSIATMRVDEFCQAPSLDWSFTDSFWIDAKSGLVWRSLQHIHPKLGELHIEIFRPPG